MPACAAVGIRFAHAAGFREEHVLPRDANWVVRLGHELQHMNPINDRTIRSSDSGERHLDAAVLRATLGRAVRGNRMSLAEAL